MSGLDIARRALGAAHETDEGVRGHSYPAPTCRVAQTGRRRATFARRTHLDSTAPATHGEVLLHITPLKSSIYADVTFASCRKVDPIPQRHSGSGICPLSWVESLGKLTSLIELGDDIAAVSVIGTRRRERQQLERSR